MILSCIRWVTIALAWLILSACGESKVSAARPIVAATTTQLGDLSRQVAGNRAETVGLLAPNSDPHSYEPSPSEVEAVASADLILLSGGDLDPWAGELIDSSGADGKTVSMLEIMGDANGGTTGTSEEQAEEADPHWWQDPTNALVAVERIRDELIAIDPEGANTYRANAASLLDEISALDREITRCMASIPAQDRKLVTSHDAFGYFAERYGIEVVGTTIPALSTQAQPSAGAIADLIEVIRGEGVETIFPEAGLSPDLEEAVADEAGATVGAELYSDALGESGSPGDTYLGALASNARILAEGFGGQGPACEPLFSDSP